MDVGGPEDGCRFEAEADVALIGMREDGRDVPDFGQKFIGVGAGGHLQIHGAKKLSWTRYVLFIFGLYQPIFPVTLLQESFIDYGFLPSAFWKLAA